MGGGSTDAVPRVEVLPYILFIFHGSMFLMLILRVSPCLQLRRACCLFRCLGCEELETKSARPLHRKSKMVHSTCWTPDCLHKCTALDRKYTRMRVGMVLVPERLPESIPHVISGA